MTISPQYWAKGILSLSLEVLTLMPPGDSAGAKIFLKSNQHGPVKTKMIILRLCELSCALVTNSRLVTTHRGGL